MAIGSRMTLQKHDASYNITKRQLQHNKAHPLLNIFLNINQKLLCHFQGMLKTKNEFVWMYLVISKSKVITKRTKAPCSDFEVPTLGSAIQENLNREKMYKVSRNRSGRGRSNSGKWIKKKPPQHRSSKGKSSLFKMSPC